MTLCSYDPLHPWTCDSIVPVNLVLLCINDSVGYCGHVEVFLCIYASSTHIYLCSVGWVVFLCFCGTAQIWRANFKFPNHPWCLLPSHCLYYCMYTNKSINSMGTKNAIFTVTHHSAPFFWNLMWAVILVWVCAALLLVQTWKTCNAESHRFY